MSAVHVTVVSDTHLSERTPEATANWDAVVDHVAATGPDLVVHAGDVSTDGSAQPDDLAFAHDRLVRLPAPWAAVPGNHDVGDLPTPEAPGPFVDAARVARFGAVFGITPWRVGLGAWHLIGLDAQLLGLGGAAEADQWTWLERELAVLRPDTPLALVLHKPLVAGPGDTCVGEPDRYVPADARARLLGLLDRVDARLVVSGHVHQTLRHRVGGVDHVWAPTTWAVIPDAVQPLVGRKVCGVVELTLHDDGRVDVATVVPPGLRHLVLGRDVEVPYEGLPPMSPDG